MPTSTKRKIEDLSNYLGPEHTIAAVLSLLDIDEFVGDPRKIHEGFFELKNKYPKLLKDFVFSSGQYYHYSDLLETVFFELQETNVIGSLNPRYDKYVIYPTAKERIKNNILPRFDIKSKKELEKISKELKPYIQAE
jgi:hypothetical protein